MKKFLLIFVMLLFFAFPASALAYDFSNDDVEYVDQTGSSFHFYWHQAGATGGWNFLNYVSDFNGGYYYFYHYISGGHNFYALRYICPLSDWNHSKPTRDAFYMQPLTGGNFQVTSYYTFSKSENGFYMVQYQNGRGNNYTIDMYSYKLDTNIPISDYDCYLNGSDNSNFYNDLKAAASPVPLDLGYVKLTNYQYINNGSSDGIHLEWDHTSTSGLDLSKSGISVTIKVIYKPNSFFNNEVFDALNPDFYRDWFVEYAVPSGVYSYDIWFNEQSGIRNDLYQYGYEIEHVKIPILNYDYDCYLRVNKQGQASGDWLLASTNIYSSGSVVNNTYTTNSYAPSNQVVITQLSPDYKPVSSNTYYYNTTNNYTDNTILPELSEDPPQEETTLPSISSIWGFLMSVVGLVTVLLGNVFDLVPWLPNWVTVLCGVIFSVTILVAVIKAVL